MVETERNIEKVKTVVSRIATRIPKQLLLYYDHHLENFQILNSRHFETIKKMVQTEVLLEFSMRISQFKLS